MFATEGITTLEAGAAQRGDDGSDKVRPDRSLAAIPAVWRTRAGGSPVRRLLLWLCGSGILLCGAVAHAESDRESYLDAVRKSGKTGIYLDVIRKAGMTHAAARDLRSAAELLVGVSILRVGRDAGGALVWTYAPNNWWTRRGDDSTGLVMIERDRFNLPSVRTELRTRIDYLKKLGDADGSGFVSTPEGWVLRRRIELAFLASQFRRPTSVRELARMLNEDLTRVVGDLTAYARMRDAAIRDGQDGFPALPEGLFVVTQR